MMKVILMATWNIAQDPITSQEPFSSWSIPLHPRAFLVPNLLFAWQLIAHFPLQIICRTENPGSLSATCHQAHGLLLWARGIPGYFFTHELNSAEIISMKRGVFCSQVHFLQGMVNVALRTKHEVPVWVVRDYCFFSRNCLGRFMVPCNTGQQETWSGRAQLSLNALFFSTPS